MSEHDKRAQKPAVTDKQIADIGFAVLRAHNDDRLWRALAYDSGPYDVTTPSLALLDLGRAFHSAGAASALTSAREAGRREALEEAARIVAKSFSKHEAEARIRALPGEKET